ncbi:MAG: cysteine desulfurase [Lentisphaeria bacterium]|nr:cysteine desulfurase [Lentisphaeria bacterium]
MSTRNLIYADNAATTQLDPAALDAMLPFLRDSYANPSSLYSFSRSVKKALQKARETVAECICATPEEIIFTSGGSESDNWVIKNFAFTAPQNRRQILTSPIEHHAILNSCAEVVRLFNCSTSYVSVDKFGIIDIDDFQAKLSKNTVGVSIMLANNEIGTIQDVKILAKLAHEHSILFHTDAVQAVGHIPVNVQELGIDMLSASAHKFNGPKGIGFLFVKQGTPLVSFVNGGQQEFARRAGTENVASIVGMATALKNNCSQMHENTLKLQKMETLFKEVISESISNVVFNGDPVHHLPGLISLSIPGASGESLLHILDLKGIAVSTGAACNSKDTEISHVLTAIQHPKDLAKGTLRISLGKNNAIADAISLANLLSHIIKKQK